MEDLFRRLEDASARIETARRVCRTADPSTAAQAYVRYLEEQAHAARLLDELMLRWEGATGEHGGIHATRCQSTQAHVTSEPRTSA